MKLTLRPADVGKEDIAKLHAAGFDDEGITVAAQVISYFNYINRIADGLGVDPEEGMEPSEEEWRAAKAKDW